MNIIKNTLRSYKDINEYNNKKVNNCPIVHAIEDSDDVFFCKQESVLIIKTTNTFGLPIIGNEDILKQPCKMYIDGVECEVTSTPQIEFVELENGEYKEYEIKYVFNTQTLTNCNHLINVCGYEELFDSDFMLLHTVDLTNFDTSNVTDMAYMFNGSFLQETLNVIGLSNLNTSNVTNMEGMFYGVNINCNGDDFKNWDTSKVTNMAYMFYYCYSLTSLDLSSFNTSNVTDMSHMFELCQGLNSLDLSSFNTSNVINMSHMFDMCRNLTSLKVDSFNASKVIDMSYMFNECKKLTSLDLSNFNTSVVTNMSYMFNYCSALISINGLNSFNTSNVTDMSYMFCWCDYLTPLDLSSFNTSNVTNMKGVFRGGVVNGLTKQIKFGKNSYVNNVSSYDVMFTSSSDKLILCNNTKESWGILITNISNIAGTSNPIPQIEYYDCE